MKLKQKQDFYDTSEHLINHIKKSENLDNINLNNSFDKIIFIIQKKQKYNRIRQFSIWSISVAATVAVIFFILSQTSPTPHHTIDVSLLDQVTASYDDKIELLTNNHIYTLVDKVSLKYEKNGQNNFKKYIIDTKQQIISNNLNRLTVPYGKTANLSLSDGTKIYINSGSTIVYPSQLGKKKREILVEGEVFLNVAKMKNCPFIVKTKNFNVNVLGTSFNVCAYKNDFSSSVVLLEGCVKVSTNAGKEFSLVPNQQFYAIKEHISIKKVNAVEHISWIKGILFIHNQPLKNIINKLERHYGCSIHCKDEYLAMKINGKLELESDLKLVIENLCYLLSINYSINQQNNKYSVNLK